jgi:hypothetical protein
MGTKLKDFRKAPKRDGRRCDGSCPTPWPLVDKEICERCYERPTDLPFYGTITVSPHFWERPAAPISLPAPLVKTHSGKRVAVGQRSLFEAVAS